MLTLALLLFSDIAQAQTKQGSLEQILLYSLYFIGCVAISVIMGIIYRKMEERKKMCQPYLIKIFKKQDFAATEIIWTNCRYKMDDDESIYNIVLGIKNNTLSFFGGGSSMAIFQRKNEKAIFSTEIVHFFGKLLKADDDFLLFNSQVAYRLFPNNREKFRHLLDIPLDKIEDIHAQQIGKELELTIEYAGDNFIKLLPACKNINPKIEIVNMLIDSLVKVMENDTLSKARIAMINDKMFDIVKNDFLMTGKRYLKNAGAVLGGAAAIGGLAAGLGARGWSRDR